MSSRTAAPLQLDSLDRLPKTAPPKPPVAKPAVAKPAVRGSQLRRPSRNPP